MARVLERLEQSPSLYQAVQEAIKNYILDNQLQPGDPLPPENELARELGVSRNSVREAVKSLESLGIVEARRGSGLYVGNFSFDLLLENLPFGLLSELQQLTDLLEIRHILEMQMIETAIRTMSDHQIAILQEIIERMRSRAEKGQVLLEEDREFHQRLFQSVGNRTLLKLLDVFWVTFRKAAESADIRDTDPMHTYYDHVAIFEAVKARNVEQARDALKQHYKVIESRLHCTQQTI